MTTEMLASSFGRFKRMQSLRDLVAYLDILVPPLSFLSLDIHIVSVLKTQDSFDSFLHPLHRFDTRHMNPSMTEATLDSLLQALHNIHSRTTSDDRYRRLLRLRDIEEVVEQRLPRMQREEVELVQYNDHTLLEAFAWFSGGSRSIAFGSGSNSSGWLSKDEQRSHSISI